MDISRLPRNKYIWLGFALLLLLALLTNLGYTQLQLEEPRRAIVSLEMHHTGNYIVPKINHFDYYNKPPVYNWVLIAFFKIFQSAEEWVIRLPTVCSLLTIAAINFFVIRRKFDTPTAFYTSLIFLTASNILFYFSFQGEIDMFYSLIVYLQVICLLHFFQQKQYAALFLISYFLTAVGVLTKGIPSLAFQAITILTIFIYYKRWRALFSPWNFVGILLMTSIIGGYFYLYNLENDPLPMITRLITESSKRTIVEESWYNSLAQLYKFPLLLFTLMMPWSLMLFSAKIRQVWRSVLQHDWVRLCLLFVISNAVVYWLSPGTRDRYLYMFIPFISLIIYRLFNAGPNKFFNIVIIALEVIVLAGAVGIPFYSQGLSLLQNISIAAFLFIS
ncbi:MAG: glycosyltransferase family 39 protein, partial [Cyclobacteriaceae bacterium]